MNGDMKMVACGGKAQEGGIEAAFNSIHSMHIDIGERYEGV